MAPVKAHVPTAGAKVSLYGIGQEWILRTITRADYTERAREVLRDDRAQCRKACCKHLSKEGGK